MTAVKTTSIARATTLAANDSRWPQQRHARGEFEPGQQTPDQAGGSPGHAEGCQTRERTPDRRA